MDQVTNRQLYDAIHDLETSVNKKIDELVDKRISPLERQMDKVYIYGGLVVAVVVFVVDFAVTWLKNKFI